jgi:hypothetical protein
MMAGYGRNNVMRKSATAAANKAVTLTLPKPEGAMRVFVQSLFVGLGGKGTVGSSLVTVQDGMILPEARKEAIEKGETPTEENEATFPTAAAFGTQPLELAYQGAPGKAIVIALAAAGTEVVGYLTAIFYID